MPANQHQQISTSKLAPANWHQQMATYYAITVQPFFVTEGKAIPFPGLVETTVVTGAGPFEEPAELTIIPPDYRFIINTLHAAFGKNLVITSAARPGLFELGRLSNPQMHFLQHINALSTDPAALSKVPKRRLQFVIESYMYDNPACNSTPLCDCDECFLD